MDIYYVKYERSEIEMDMLDVYDLGGCANTLTLMLIYQSINWNYVNESD